MTDFDVFFFPDTIYIEQVYMYAFKDFFIFDIMQRYSLQGFLCGSTCDY